MNKLTKTLRINALFATVVALSGCVTSGDLDKRLDQWVGQDADTLATSWGAPSGTYQKKDGSRILTYERSSVLTTGQGIDSQTNSRQCRIDFVTDGDGKIASTSWHGAKDQCDRSIPKDATD